MGDYLHTRLPDQTISTKRLQLKVKAIKHYTIMHYALLIMHCSGESIRAISSARL